MCVKKLFVLLDDGSFFTVRNKMLLRSPPGISMQLEKGQAGQAVQTMYPHNESNLRYFANNR